jgi:hypothetical protein
MDFECALPRAKIRKCIHRVAEIKGVKGGGQGKGE